MATVTTVPEPVKAWPEGYRPLSTEEAIVKIAERPVQGGFLGLMLDIALMEMLEDGHLCIAVDAEGEVHLQHTKEGAEYDAAHSGNSVA